MGEDHQKLVVLGGGVAGVCCAQELCRLRPQAAVTLISADATVKAGSFAAHQLHSSYP